MRSGSFLFSTFLAIYARIRARAILRGCEWNANQFFINLCIRIHWWWILNARDLPRGVSPGKFRTFPEKFAKRKLRLCRIQAPAAHSDPSYHSALSQRQFRALILSNAIENSLVTPFARIYSRCTRKMLHELSHDHFLLRNDNTFIDERERSYWRSIGLATFRPSCWTRLLRVSLSLFVALADKMGEMEKLEKLEARRRLEHLICAVIDEIAPTEPAGI